MYYSLPPLSDGKREQCMQHHAACTYDHVVSLTCCLAVAKVPTNQLEAVVKEVLKMVGVEAKALPKRATGQNMRREMGHVADVVAGVLLAKAHNVTGASDDTTKRQRTLAADLTHHKLPDDSLRTLCIGLSCMSSGTAKAKVDRYAEKMAQVQAAARLSVPEFHGDVAAFDRVTLLDLINQELVLRPLHSRAQCGFASPRAKGQGGARTRGWAAARGTACGWLHGVSAVACGGGWCSCRVCCRTA